MRTTLILLISFLITWISLAQQPEWAQFENVHHKDEFYKSVFVNKPDGGVIVNALLQQTQQQGGGTTVPDKRFLYAYDQAGNALWNMEAVHINVFELLTKDDGAFWIIGFGTETIQLGSQTITSPYAYPNFRSLYFIEMDTDGVVLDSFVYPVTSDLFVIFSNVVLDHNQDFIISATVQPQQFSPVNFSFGAHNTLLDPDKRLHFIGRIQSNGTPAEIFTYTSSRFSTNLTIPQALAINHQNGNILLAGGQGEFLSIGTDDYFNTGNYRQLYLGLLDEHLNLIGSTTEEVSTYGTILSKAIYNEYSNSFYLLGTWGNTLYYGQNTPLSGHPGTVQNRYLAKLLPNSLGLDEILTFIPQGQAYSNFIGLYDMAVADNGSIVICGTITVSAVEIGDKIYTIDSGSPTANYESLLIILNLDLSMNYLDTSTDDGNSLFRSIVLNGEGIYCSGSFLNNFQWGVLTGVSVANKPDAFVVKFNAPDLLSNEAHSGLENKFFVYPVPLGSGGTLYFSQRTSGSVYTLQGKKVLNVVDSDRINELQLKKGVYFFKPDYGSLIRFIME